MQPFTRASNLNARTTFSILGRIGGDATNPLKHLAPPEKKLSVSSVGSEAMQLVTVTGRGGK